MTETRTQWTKSSYSGGEGEACVEWRKGLAAGAVTEVDVCDSKEAARNTTITVSPAAWKAFVGSVSA
jgi:hypothetical protein